MIITLKNYYGKQDFMTENILKVSKSLSLSNDGIYVKNILIF